ncbi:hypothetical protein P152DRAFT_161275 [Eremomyces bilateralis CBS 781.70]|uniref:Pal1-domain-containing protein n=1 Tax=Eremomyces bilateralis CBS 781.70 TaxID=1392243 RepID=A0A6G1FUC5_9PEZI|nr:uncharacterized protein P152DRAFT_161275 [Eremomyces bilateralis CBS 781.70]KAF1809350.1 hypothetical protein P152DRAFT_161275 [Eremomyces bilateralis CBS 781.70]
MTTVSAQPIPVHTTISSQSSWDYAVPVERENIDSGDTNPSETPIANGAPRQPLMQHTGTNEQRPNRSDTLESNLSTSTTNGKHLAQHAPRSNPVSKKHSKSSMGSDPDGFGDLYKAPSAEARNLPHSADHGGKRKLSSSSKGMSPNLSQSSSAPIPGGLGAAFDHDFWIHRDKLAQIESRELEEAGFRLPASRSGSRSASSSRNRFHDHGDEINGEPGHGREREEKKQRRISPIPAEDEAEDGAIDFELRTPEEVAADMVEPESWGSSPYPSRILRPSTSRIPIAKMSPVPVSSDMVDRDSPLSRSRNGSGAWGSMDGGVAFPRNGHSRARSRSAGSQVLLDDAELQTPTDSPPRRKTTVSPGQSPSSSPPRANKKGSVTKRGIPSASKPRVVSNTNRGAKSPEKRPGTSSGRPSTSHAAPEGDPPWLASMYKPDPRLPPDQQMLPTHAKRMAQERWESEGKTGSAYDRDFRLLNAADYAPPVRSSAGSAAEIKGAHRGAEADDDGRNIDLEWPLPSPTLPKEANGSPRPGTSESHGGYKITPSLRGVAATSPSIGGSKLSAGQPQGLDLNQRPVRVQEPVDDEKAGKKKGCTCCVVM